METPYCGLTEYPISSRTGDKDTPNRCAKGLESGKTQEPLRMPESGARHSPAISAAQASLAPVAASQRIDSMDILRGVALVGILVMNIEWFGRSISEFSTFDQTLSGLDHAVGWLVRCFVEGKFYKLFALLFGMGFAVMLLRAQEKGMAFGAWFTRRMLVLFVIGLMHSFFIWPGDILHDYAVAGLLLLGWVTIFQSSTMKTFNRPNTFLRIALIWMAFPIMAAAVAGGVVGMRYDNATMVAAWEEDQQVARLVEERMALPRAPEEIIEVDVNDGVSSGEKPALTPGERIEAAVATAMDARRDREESIEREVAIYTTGSYREATQYRFTESLRSLGDTLFFALIVLMPTFLVGYWFVASGVLRKRRENRHIFRPMTIIGLSFGFCLTVSGLVLLQHPASQASLFIADTGNTLFFFGQYVLCAGYVGLIILLLDRQRWFTFLNRFAPMGRMALTNYIMQTTILALIFHGYAGGLFGTAGRAPQMLIAAVILVFQLYFSAWWLRKYRFGPLEWLWRSLTYQSIQPVRV